MSGTRGLSVSNNFMMSIHFVYLLTGATFRVGDIAAETIKNWGPVTFLSVITC
jgi:hypothetical protein